MESYDLVIIGAGPAGCLAALSAPSGTRTLLVDRLRLPRDVICGGIISTSVMDRLSHLGPPDSVFSDPPRIRWSLFDWTLGRGGPFTDRSYFNVDRAGFDAWLLDRASALENVDVWASTRFMAFEEFDDILKIYLDRDNMSIEVASRHLIGADGARSMVRKLLGISSPDCWLTVQETLRSSGEDVDRFLAFMGDGIEHYGWVIPKGRDIVVGIGASGKNDQAMEVYSKFRERLKQQHGIQGTSVEKLRARPVTRLRRSSEICAGRGHVLLTGEAAGLICPWSGEGIGHAIRSGSMAGRSLATCHPLRSYRMQLKRLMPGVYVDLLARKSMKRPWARRLISLGAPGTVFVPMKGSPNRPADS